MLILKWWIVTLCKWTGQPYHFLGVQVYLELLLCHFFKMFLHQFSAGWNFSCLPSISVLLCFSGQCTCIFNSIHGGICVYVSLHSNEGVRKGILKPAGKEVMGTFCLDALFFLMHFSSTIVALNRAMHTLFSKWLPEPTFPKTFKGCNPYWSHNAKYNTDDIKSFLLVLRLETVVQLGFFNFSFLLWNYEFCS